jgi:hypothetical protein
MVSHPLFDERVLELFPGVTDEFIKCAPKTIQAADIVLHPGPEGRETETTLAITFPDADSPPEWALPDSVALAGQKLAIAWIATGHKMPAFQFNHRRNADGQWHATMEPLLEW